VLTARVKANSNMSFRFPGRHCLLLECLPKTTPFSSMRMRGFASISSW
jgi:hypothetical protein